jgi:carboxyl-terminal processing protease
MLAVGKEGVNHSWVVVLGPENEGWRCCMCYNGVGFSIVSPLAFQGVHAMPKSRILFVVIILLAGLAAFGLATSCNLELSGRVGGNPEQSVEDLPPEFDRVAEVWALLQREHIDREELDAQELSEGAIRGMLQSLDDPYASYLDPEQFEVESQDFKGFFEGIGAQVGMREGRLTIIAPIPDTPAERAGIKPGDVILEINKESTANITLLEAVSKIRGEKGTKVELLVLHLNEQEPETIVVERGVIPLNSVRFSMLDGGIGHLRIFNFTDTTNDEVEEALEEFKRSNGVGLVLDLRNNPGGLLRSVVDVASQFLAGGLVLYEIDAQGDRTDWKVKPGGKGQDIPLVVLINEFSASASEVLSGTLIDHDRATVIGATSFGKGSVNTLRQLSDGSGVYFSIARWYTPDGTLIEGEGITPDVVVEAPPDATEDIQLQRAIEALQQKMAQAPRHG